MYTHHGAMLHICNILFYAEIEDNRNENWANSYEYLVQLMPQCFYNKYFMTLAFSLRI